jgi:DNA helicase-2/ATP-dependent DNA helicase PcrA
VTDQQLFGDDASNAVHTNDVAQLIGPAEMRELLTHDLNPSQREAVLYDEGPLVVVAGAGSGKTRVLTRRIARIIGDGLPTMRLMAITFTNKAANEMRSRVVELIGSEAERMWISTFHSACVRILRSEAEHVGYRSGFSIYDDADSRRLVSHVLDDLNIDTKRFSPRAVAGAISAAKNEMLDAEDYANRAYTIYEQKIAEAFSLYTQRLKSANAMDFDDLLSVTVKLFRTHPEVLERYQDRFFHLLVDEYQDTNRAQNEIVTMLGKKHRNVCVVGDSDQSIYRFRGAEVRNLLDFEIAFPETKMVVLDQNYRSTQNILDAANAVIGNNMMRQEKSLWSALGEGHKIVHYHAGDERDEATFVANEAARLRGVENLGYAEMAVLYRTNSQSRAIEQALADRGIACTIIGGTRFYDRREVRDLLAFARLVANGNDEVSLRRVINVPLRGVGKTTVDRLVAYAYHERMPFAYALRNAKEVGVKGKSLKGIEGFVTLLDSLGDLRQLPPAEILRQTLYETGFQESLEAEVAIGGAGLIEAEGRLANVEELVTVADSYEDLESFLATTALVAASDDLDNADGRVTLMTLHAVKGLEFAAVFLTGLEEGIFPHERALGEPDDLEEERRLCYVGLTRARERLYLTNTWVRTVFGTTKESIPSRFLREIPEELIDDRSDPFAMGRPISRDEDIPAFVRRGPGLSRLADKRAASTAPVQTSGAHLLGLRAGEMVVHARWGEGTVKSVGGEGERMEAVISFPRQGDKKFLLALTPLKRA